MNAFFKGMSNATPLIVARRVLAHFENDVLACTLL